MRHSERKCVGCREKTTGWSMSNWILGVCLALSCLGCWTARGQDEEKVDQVGGNKSVSRPVNIFIINEEENQVANQSILAALETIREKEGNHLGKVWSVKMMSELSLNESLQEVCNSWETAVKEGGNWVPDFVLDTTRGGLGAKITNWFTARLGIPTLSAQYGKEGALPYWIQMTGNQRHYLVQVMPPGDLVPEVIPLLLRQLNADNAGILFDHHFVMDRKYRHLLLNQPTRHLIIKASQTVPEMKEQLTKIRNLGIVNYFILGGLDTLTVALEAAEALNFTGKKYGWFMFTLDDTIQLTFQSPDMSLLFVRPERKNVEKTLLAAKLPKPLLSSGFYYDLTILGVQAIKSAIDNGKWPLRPKHILCDADSIDDRPPRDIDLFSILTENYRQNISPTYATISWGRWNGEHQSQFDMSINLVRMEEGNISSVSLGSWSPTMHPSLQGVQKLRESNRTAVTSYRVVTIIHPPFIMYDQEKKKWYGFCIDLLEMIRATKNFEYDIREVQANKYGSLSEEGNWSGMIKELIDKRADIALGTLWVTAEREKVVDFTIPFYDLVGLSVIMPRRKKGASLSKYIVVFKEEVWCIILVSYAFTSSLLWILDWWSPYSYQNNREKYKAGDEKRVFNVVESFWFCMTSLTAQGGGESPKNLSGKVVAATWWLFCCVILVFYTANLAAYLTVLRLDTHPVRSLEDITQQYMIEYAPVNNSAAHTYFKRMATIEGKLYDAWKDMTLDDSLSGMERGELAVWEYPLADRYTKMFRAMLDAGLPSSVQDALKRLRRSNSNFAYIEDATTVNYLLMTNCDLVQIGSEFSRRPYAIAVQQGSPLKEQISQVILDLLNTRKLEMLKERWWKKNPIRRDCDTENSESDDDSFRSVTGIFGICFLGVIVTFITLALEYCYYRHMARIVGNHKNAAVKGMTTVVKPMFRFNVQPSPTHTLQRSKFRLRF